MEPTKKDPAIDAVLTAITGRDRQASIRGDSCVFSEDGAEHNMQFRDGISIKEYRISGMCQTCQDSVFGE